jgi:N-acetyl-anhydromuramyl-L-alanine amidase AmpD
MGDGWCPFAIRRELTTGNFYEGRWGNPIRAVVLHIAAGPLRAIFPTFNHPDAASAHFGIGKDGAIEQYVSINNGAYAVGLHWVNGQWFNPQKLLVKNPSWVDLVPGVNPNLYTISIEHEGQPQDIRTPEMHAACTRLLRWISEETGLTYVAHRTLIGHNEIDPVSRPNCPGPNFDFDLIAADANGAQVSSELTQAAQAALASQPQLAINPDAALYRFAQVNGLGYPQTDEFMFTLDNAPHVMQVFLNGIVFVKVGDWGNVQWLQKPDVDQQVITNNVVAGLAGVAMQQRWMTINTSAALYSYAQAHGLGFPQTDEFSFVVGADQYIGQAYQGGIVCVKVGDWGNIKLIARR